MSDRLLRQLAPISDAAWELIEDDARQRLQVHLAARKVVDVTGPMGWEFSATNLGRTEAISGPTDAVVAAQRVVLGAVELRAPFTLLRRELDNIDRGSLDPDLGPLDVAAAELALAENIAVFQGLPGGEIQGVTEATTHDAITLHRDAGHIPAAIAAATDRLRASGIAEPYALALAPDVYTLIAETTEHGGYPLIEHLVKILGGPMVWAPGVECGVVLSQRGGDFLFESGEDVALGYASHDADSVSLYLEESFTFRVVEPDAAVTLEWSAS